MNPDKLFDYLDGKLSASERADFEARLVSDEHLQRELAVARRIHAGMRGDSHEVVLPDPAVTEKGRKMALRFGTFFIVLMAVNVGAGLWIIAHKESKNPNRELLEKQTRDQIKKSLEAAAVSALAPAPSLGVTELTVSAAPGQLDSVADKVVALARRLGGSPIKGLPDHRRLTIFLDLPEERDTEFRAGLSTISGGISTIGPTAETPKPTSEKRSFIIHVSEPLSATLP